MYFALIKSLIEDGSFFEINIPKLKELTIKLKEKISNLNNESHKIQEQLQEYQNILNKGTEDKEFDIIYKQIEGLKIPKSSIKVVDEKEGVYSWPWN